MAAKLVYSAIASLDGYVEDADGRFDWSVPDEEVHAFVNALERPVGTYLYGRRMYETMRYWGSADAGGQSPASREYAEIWRAAEKIVYSRTLDGVSTARTRLVREFDADEVGHLKQASAADISVGGAELAGLALHAGLVDELHLLLVPVLVGAGKRALPELRAGLELAGERRFAGGAVHLHSRLIG